MIRTILATVALAAMTGGAVAQYLPSDAGLTPGAPVGRDPVTGDPIRAGEPDPLIADNFDADAAVVPEVEIERQSVFVPVERRAAVIVAPDLDQLGPAELGRSTLNQPAPPSDAGLTPGAPLAEDWNGGKVVADYPY